MTMVWSDLGPRSRRVTHGTNEAAPTLPTEGINLMGVTSIIPVLHAPTGQTFTGTGSLLAYLLPPYGATWVRAPRADYDLTDVAGLSDVALPALSIESPFGRFVLVPSSVGVTGGSTLSTDLVCAMDRKGDSPP